MTVGTHDMENKILRSANADIILFLFLFFLKNKYRRLTFDV